MLVILTLQGTPQGTLTVVCLLGWGLRALELLPGPSPWCLIVCWELLPRAGKLPALRGRWWFPPLRSVLEVGTVLFPSLETVQRV